MSSSSTRRDAVRHVAYEDRAKDPAGWIESREQMGREYFVALATVKLIRDELGQCYRQHGVNHFQKCKELREEYGRLIRDQSLGMLQVCRRVQYIGACLLLYAY